MKLEDRYVIEPTDMRQLQGAIIDIVRYLEENCSMGSEDINHIMKHLNVIDRKHSEH